MIIPIKIKKSTDTGMMSLSRKFEKILFLLNWLPLRVSCSTRIHSGELTNFRNRTAFKDLRTIAGKSLKYALQIRLVIENFTIFRKD